jgi:transposase
LVDNLSLLLYVKVLVGNIQNRDGAKILFAEIKERMARLYLIWADGGCRGTLRGWVATTCMWLVQVVKRNDEVKGFVLLPRRWVVERTFGWVIRNRRLSKDYERQCELSEVYISCDDSLDGQALEAFAGLVSKPAPSFVRNRFSYQTHHTYLDFQQSEIHLQRLTTAIAEMTVDLS